MSAISAALSQIEATAEEGELAAGELAPLSLEAAGEPIVLPDGRTIYPPSVFGEPVDRLACSLLDMQEPSRSRFLRLIGPPGTGKALALDTPIATPSGWTTMGELQVGDEVFDPQGRPTPVVATSAVMTNRTCLEVVFSDGSTIVADADHLWVTETRADRTRGSNRARRGGLIARRLGSNGEISAVRVALASEQSRHVTRRQLARELGWDTQHGYRRVKTASVRCQQMGCAGREVVYDRGALLRSLERMLAANVGEHNSRRIATAPITTRRMAETLTAAGRVNHAIRVAQPLELPEADLPVPPRLLGLWLGDGSSQWATLTTGDPELADEFAVAGYQVRKSTSLCYMISLTGLGRRRAEPCARCGSIIDPGRERRWYCAACLDRVGTRALALAERRCACGTMIKRWAWSDSCKACRKHTSLLCQLRGLGVIGNKHIPTAYQRASISQRRALFSGLLDTDGTVSPGGAVEYTTTNAQLAADVQELACSLGYRAVCREGRAMLNGKDCGSKWTVSLSTREEVFGLARKQRSHAQRSRSDTDARTRARYVVEVRSVESVAVRCIQVGSPDGLFLAGRTLIPTHNSQVARAIAYRLWRERGRAVAERHGQPFYGFVEMSPGPSADEFFFRYEYLPTAGGEVRLVDSAFVEAMRAGWVVMIDEVNVARDVALLSINSTLDGRLALYLPATGETVVAAPGFAVLLAYNPGLVGATDIPDAWHSRFPATVEVGSNWSALASMGVPERLVRCAAALDRRRRDGEDGLVWTPQFRDLESLWDMMGRVGERLALALFCSNLHEQVSAGKVQEAEAAAACRMLEEAGYAHLKVSASGRTPNLHGFPRAVCS